MIIILIIIATSCSLVQLTTVRDGNDLVHKLCNLNTTTNLVLNCSIKYYISSDHQSCVVNGSHSLTILSSDPNKLANVSCSNDSILTPSFGIAFVNVSVTIARVKFDHCGTRLTNFKALDMAKISGLSFSPNHSALFVFIRSTIDFFDIIITDYNGFAVIAINVANANITKVRITSDLDGYVSSLTEKSIGSGVLVIYSNSTSVASSSSFVFRNSTFSVNIDSNFKALKGCSPLSNDKKIYNAAGLTVLSYGIKEKVIVDISRTVFYSNYGNQGGALLIILMSTKTTIVNIGKDSRFESNFIVYNCSGAAIAFHMNDQNIVNVNNSIVPLSVTDTFFIENRGITGDDMAMDLFRAGTIYVKITDPSVKTSVEFRNVRFDKNMAFKISSCLYFKVDSYSSAFVDVTFENVDASENSQSLGVNLLSDMGIFSFINVHNVYFKGNNHFVKNIGTVIKSYHSNIHLNGNNTFKSNLALSGAAINIEDSYLYIDCTKKFQLIDNTANITGGAIYAHNTNTDASPLCAVEFLSSNSCKIVSQNNIADKGGNTMFAYPIYNCYEKSSQRFVKPSKNYTKLFEISGGKSRSNNNLEISTKVHHMVECNNSNNKRDNFGGIHIRFGLIAIDEAGNNVYSRVHFLLAKIANETKLIHTKSKIIMHGQMDIMESKKRNHCTNFSVKLLFYDHKNESKKLYLFATPEKSSQILKIIVQIQSNCSLGFQLNNGICECSKAVEKFYKMYNMIGNCDTDSLTIQKPNNFIYAWLGNISHDPSKFAIAYHCPIEFCHYGQNYSHYHVTYLNDSFKEFRFVNLYDNHSESLCRENRAGVLCGNCNESVVFGSGECRGCSNWSLFTIVLYIVSGPLVLCVLFALRLTLEAGTINGIIFFAQTANLGILQMLEQYKTSHPIFGYFAFVFVSMLNLNLGFPLCFFDGMNELQKTGLLLIFPVYLTSIALLVTIFCHYSSHRFSKRTVHLSEQVFITIVHISIFKLLITAIDVFTPVRLISDEQDDFLYVWYRNGSISFSFSHSGLAGLMGATFVILCTFLIPYLILLTSGKYLIKSSFGEKHFRSVYESILVPYRDGKKYWFVVRFFLLLLFHIVYAIFRGLNTSLILVIVLPLLMAFFLLQVYLRPFKSKIITFLDTIVLLDLVLICTTGWYIIFDLRPTNYDNCMTVVVVLVFFIFITFVCIVIHHILLMVNFYQRVIIVWNYYSTKNNDTNQLISPSDVNFQDSNGTRYKSCDK